MNTYRFLLLFLLSQPFLMLSQKDSISQDLSKFLDAYDKTLERDISLGDSTKFFEIAAYLANIDSIDSVHIEYLEGRILSRESSLREANLAASYLIAIGGRESIEFLVTNIGWTRPHPNSIRPHDLNIYPCYVPLRQAKASQSAIKDVVLSSSVLNNFKIQPMVIGNTAYLLRSLLDESDMCKIEHLQGSSTLTKNGIKVLNEIKNWMDN